MPTAALSYSPPQPGRLRRAEAWLDARGKSAWIAAMVLGFIFFWPVGLAFLAYMIWGKGMFGQGFDISRGRGFGWGCGRSRGASSMRGSGNSAFDAYRDETLRRLEDEQNAFDAFLQRLRDARDKQEFDSFMEDRARKAAAPPDGAEG